MTVHIYTRASIAIVHEPDKHAFYFKSLEARNMANLREGKEREPLTEEDLLKARSLLKKALSP